MCLVYQEKDTLRNTIPRYYFPGFIWQIKVYLGIAFPRKNDWKWLSGKPLQYKNTNILFSPSVYLNKNPKYLMNKLVLRDVIVLTFTKMF